jgi:hypothetical protein
MIHPGFPTLIWFCDACVCLLMSKACVCSGSFVYTSLQLLENECWCRGFASGGWFDLPCSSLWLVLDLLHGLLLNRKQFFARAVPGWGFWLCVLPVLSVLAIWWLTKMPVDEWASSGGGKRFYMNLLLLPGRQLGLATLGDSSLACVLYSMHTCSVSCLCVCVCTWYFELGLERISSAELIISAQFFLSF